MLDLTLLAMDKIGDGRAINIGMGRLTSFLEIIEVFTGFAGYKPTIKTLLDKPVGVHSRYCDMTWVEQNLGWKAKVSIEDGIRRVYQAALKKSEECRATKAQRPRGSNIHVAQDLWRSRVFLRASVPLWHNPPCLASFASAPVPVSRAALPSTTLP